MTLIKHNPLATFTFITFLFSWFFWLPQALYSQGYLAMQNPLWGLGSFGPSIAGIIVVAVVSGKNGLKELWFRLLDWRLKLRWFIFIILFPPLIICIAFLIHRFTGGTVPAWPSAESLFMLIPNFFLILVLGGPLNEELGWRGFMLPHLLKFRNPLPAAFIVGVFWAVWHLPLFWISGASQEGIPTGLVLLQIIALSFIFTWLHNRTRGSLIIPLFFHAALNTSGAILPILPAQAGSLQPYIITVVLAVVFTLFLVIITSGKL
jgi:uncharacterized protein